MGADHSFEIRETRTDKFLEFLTSEGWENVGEEVFPTLDATEFIFQKGDDNLKVFIEFDRKTQVSGIGNFVEGLEKGFSTSLNSSSNAPPKLNVDVNDPFEPLNKKINPWKVLVSEWKSIKFIDVLYLVILTTLFLLPLAVWSMVRLTGSNAGFATWEIILIVLVLAVFTVIFYVLIQGIAFGIHSTKLYESALAKSGYSADIRFIEKANKLIPMSLKMHVYSRVYNQSYRNAFASTKLETDQHLILVGDIEISWTRRINNKIGSMTISEQSFLFIDGVKNHVATNLNDTNEVLEFLKGETQINGSELSRFKLTGKAHDTSVMIFFEELIELPGVKLEILNYLKS